MYIKPARRSAGMAHFDVSLSSMMTIRVLDEKGREIKPGVVVYDRANAKKYVVGLEGDLYVDRPSDQQTVELDVQNNYNCRIIIKASDQPSDQLSDKIDTY